MLLILDLLANIKSPDYISLYKQNYLDGVAQQAAAQKAIFDQMADPKVQKMQFPLNLYVGVYKHPAYGTLNISLTPDSKGLQVEMSEAGRPRAEQTFNFVHMWYETWGVNYTAMGGWQLFGVGFESDGYHRPWAITANFEPSVAPILFTNQAYAVQGLGFQWPQKCDLPAPAPVPPAPDSVNAELTSKSLWTLVALTVFFCAIVFSAILACVTFICGKRIVHQLTTNGDPLLTAYATG